MTPVRQTGADAHAETLVAKALADAWKCELYEWGAFSPIDRYAVRGGAIIGVLEIKCRSVPSWQYPSVNLSVRKWIALTLVSAGLSCRAVYVVRFTDGIFWAPIDAVPGQSPELRGRAHMRQSSDREPMLQVPADIMRRLTTEAGL